jgi:hypothetical protein
VKLLFFRGSKAQMVVDNDRVVAGHSVAAGSELWSEKPEVDGSTPSLTTRYPQPSYQAQSASLCYATVA